MTSKSGELKGWLSSYEKLNFRKFELISFRSCVRKIIEKDDTSSNKCIILFVSKIFEQISKNNLVRLFDPFN